jgi:hypothetical protein
VNQLMGHPAEDLARLCFSKLRFYPVSLKDRLRREGLWEDLAQELYRIALEGWRQGRSPREIGGMATREIRDFLKAYGYYRYRESHREGFIRWDTPLSDVSTNEEQSWDGILAKAKPLPERCECEGLEESILRLLRKYPEGLSQRQVNIAHRRLAQAVVVNDYCARLVVRGVLREMVRPKGNGRPPGPILVLVRHPFKAGGDHLAEKILALIRKSPEGMSKRTLSTRLCISRQELDWHCRPMIAKGLIVEVKRETTFGRTPTPILVAAGQEPPALRMVKTEQAERIRHAYFAEKKGIKQIARELHHSKTTVRRAIRSDAVEPG